MGFTRAELERYRNRTVDDLIGPGCRLLFVGINPGLWTAATNTHFCHPSNRFYPALRAAGLIDWVIDPQTGMTDEQRVDFLTRGMGITNLVARATARASELSRCELSEGARRVARVVAEVRPAVVAVAGVTAYRTAFGLPKAAPGPQAEPLAGASVWVVPNPSGLNAHETLTTLAGWYSQAAEAAGLV
ncbi:MAG TPA: mismatch-specific DNA-glycosylase [Acidimicrobiia bacterium]|nr:mismatch-specific DNA-glycosylase [Acidimicrobiia bacterium]